MKAAIRRQYGPPQSIKIETIEKPKPKDQEVLIKVFATTVNRTDGAILTGRPFIMKFFLGLRKPKSPFLGTDFAGIVEAVGKKVTAFKVNDKVFGFRDEGLASQAEYMCFAADGAILKMPDNTTYQEAVASIEGVHYAYNFMNKLPLNKGDKVLLNGATGAIGSALLQFLKHRGIYTTAVCNTKNIALIKSLGADKIYDYTKEDFTKEADDKYDVVLDAVGKSSFGKCKPLLKKGGVYLSSELGWMAQNIFLALTTPFFGTKKVIFPLPSNIKQSLLFIKDLIEQGQFKAVIDRSYPLEEIASAYTYVATGQKTGNVILEMQANPTS